MSEGTANRRVEGSKLVRRMPALIDHLKSGTLTLSALVQVRKIIDEKNYEELIPQMIGKTRDEIAALIARIAPKPDAPAMIRQLASSHPPLETPADRARLEPSAEARWRLHVTADQELHDKILRARALMSHRNRSGELEVIISAALDALLEKLEKPRKPRPEPRTPSIVKAGAISAATRSAVFERDGQQCTYRSKAGERCPAKMFLELDHIEPRARGGSGDASNLRVRCQAHNLLHAEEQFGRPHIEAKIRASRQRRVGARAGP